MEILVISDLHMLVSIMITGILLLLTFHGESDDHYYSIYDAGGLSGVRR